MFITLSSTRLRTADPFNAQPASDPAEHGADLLAQDCQDADNNNCNEHQDEPILYKTLALFLRKKAPQNGDNFLCLLRCRPPDLGQLTLLTLSPLLIPLNTELTFLPRTVRIPITTIAMS